LREAYPSTGSQTDGNKQTPGICDNILMLS
jgi:hypothetical protein